MYRSIKIALLSLTLIFFLTPDGYAQVKKKNKRSKSDSLRAAILRRDSLMRFYKTSDTSTNNLLQKIEYYSLSFNQISNTLSKGLDTVEISEQLPRLEKTAKLIKTLIARDRSSTLRYLYAIRDILDKRQDQLDVWQDKLADMNGKLFDIRDDLMKRSHDSTFTVFPSDSTLRLTFLQQRATIELKGQKLDSMNKRALLKVGILQNRLAAVYIAIIDQKDLINLKIRNFSINALHNEYGYIWNMQTAKGSTFKAALDRTAAMNLKLFRLLNDAMLRHIMLIMLLVSFFSWIYFNKRKIVKTIPKYQDILKQTIYVSGSPIACTLLVISIVMPFFYDHPPVVFLELVFLVTVMAVLYLTWRTCPKPLYNYLHLLFWLTLLFSISNLFVEVCAVDRIALLVISALTVIISIRFLLHIRSSHTLYMPYSRIVLILLILLEGASFLCNVTGRFSLAKIIGVTAVYNLWLAVALYYFVQILIQSMFLQLEANKIDKDNISSYLDFKVLQSKLRYVLHIVAVIIWVVMLLQNLSIEDNVFDFITNFLTQSRTLGGTLFTFGSIIIFIGVIWIASILARIISYFYDFADQHRAGSHQQRKSRTSLLLIRISVFCIGFLLAVGASGFPLDKLTIIISALGVGVGFGLQNIVNNLVSGLILAFEKPVQVGDVIEVASRTGTIREIGIRSSKIATGNGAEIIIPNGDLISQHVINWTLSNNNRQVELSISVAYGSDLDKVKGILRDVLDKRDDIMMNPAPVVYLNNLTPASIDFKILFWAADISMWQQLRSRILSAIYKVFAEQGIEVPQAQQNVHLIMPENGLPLNKNPLSPDK